MKPCWGSVFTLDLFNTYNPLGGEVPLKESSVPAFLGAPFHPPGSPRHHRCTQGNSPVIDALFADSVPTGSRTQLYTRLYIFYILGQGLGPAAAAAVFFYTGNSWNLEVRRGG